MPLNRRIQIGSKIGNSTSGSILFADSNTTLAQDNSELFYDNTNNRLGIGTTSPGANIEVMNTNATDKGVIIQGAASQSGDLLQFMDSSSVLKTTINSSGNIVLLTDNQTLTDATSGILVNLTSTVTQNYANNSFQCFQFNPSVILDQAGNLFGTFLGFDIIPSVSNINGEANNIGLTQMIKMIPTFQADGATITHFGSTGVTSGLQISRINSGAITVNSHTDFSAGGGTGVGAGCTLTTRTAFLASALTNSGTFTTQIGLDVSTLTQATTNIAIRTGAGGVIQFGNLITKYNNISTVSNGVPSELATVDLTAQTAAIAATTIYTPAATGMFRISAYLQITTAASTSSILGGATGIVITYNDGDGNVAQSDTMGLFSPTGTVVTTLNTNTTATNLEGTMVIYARTGVAIKYAVGYTSVGLTAMQFAAHLKVEAM